MKLIKYNDRQIGESDTQLLIFKRRRGERYITHKIQLFNNLHTL